MILFQLANTSRLNPMSRPAVRDLMNRPAEFKRNVETLSRAKSNLKTIEKIVKEKSNKKEESDVKVKNEYKTTNGVTKLLSILGRSTVTVEDVKTSEVDGEIIITTMVSKFINGLEDNNLIPEEFSEFLELKDEFLSLLGKYVSKELEQFEEYLKFSKSEKQEITKFLNNFDDTVDLIISAYLKDDTDKILDEVEIPECLVKTFINIYNSDKELDLNKFNKIFKGFLSNNNIDLDLVSLIDNFEKIQNKKETKNIEDKKESFKFVNSKALAEKLVEYFKLPMKQITQLLTNGSLKFENNNFKNEFIISGDKLVECKFTNKETNEVIVKTMLFDEKGLVYEN